MSAACPRLGFIVSVQLFRGSIMQLLSELAPVLESHGLTFHARGVGDSELEILREGSQATDADREMVERWASTWRDRARITVSGVFDLSETR